MRSTRGHFSIGSAPGSRWRTRSPSIGRSPGIRAMFARRCHRSSVAAAPILEKLVAAADRSARWYERFPEHMALEPIDSTMSYVMRSGRIDLGRLRRLSPRFVARCRAGAGGRHPRPVVPGARAGVPSR